MATHNAADPDLGLEDLELSLQNIVTSLDKEKLIELAGHIGLKDEAVSDKSRLSLTKLILSEVDKQNLKFDETGKSESKKVFMQDLISLAKGTVPPLENETGSVTEDSGSEDPSLKIQAVQKLEKELLELKLKYEADVNAIKEKSKVVSGMGVEAGPEDVTSFSQLKTIFKHEFKFNGTIGAPNSKDALSYISLTRQIHSAKQKGYEDPETFDALIEAISPGLQLRTYLEAMREAGLETVMKIIRAHFQEKSASELFGSLANLVQLPTEDPQNFLLRALNLREKIVFASEQENTKLKYDKTQCQNLFLHTIETGLLSNTIRSRMRSLLMKPGVTDAELISQLNTAVAEEAERNSELGIGQKGNAKVSKVESQAVSCKIGKDKPASQPSASLSELKEIRAEVVTLKQEVYYKKSAGAKASSKTPAYKKMRRGCKACHDTGEADSCRHCWKCGDAAHFAFNCPQPQENCPRLLPRDNQ